MSSAGPLFKMSAGAVIVSALERETIFLLLRAYRNWDFPKGLVETGETPIDAAIREVREETTLAEITFDWGPVFVDTGPYNKGKIARYYIAHSRNTRVALPVNPTLGRPEHHEARWVDYERGLSMVSPRLQPVMRWAHGVVSKAGSSAKA